MEKNKVLYISYTGMGEALGASQVLSYLGELSKDYSIFLISLEKESDYRNNEKMKKLHDDMEMKNIAWYPDIYISGIKGYVINFKKTYSLAKKIILKENVCLLHCRSYRPAIIAYFLKKWLKKVDYIFDTRGFWFDEKADVGRWSHKAITYRLVKKIEEYLYNSAFYIVMLSELGKDTIQRDELFKGGRLLNNITVIPTCVDLNRYTQKQFIEKDSLTLGYLGTAVGWYDFEKTAELFSLLKKQICCNIVIFNGGQHQFIKNVMSKYGLNENMDYTLEKVDFLDIPTRMKEFDISLFFIHPFFSKRASTATKLGELFATGIPVITNAGVGDHEIFINKYSTGKIVDPNNLSEYDFGEIVHSLNIPIVSNNCRKLAENYFSLEGGVKEYKKIYQMYFDVL